eukprot:COSAG04_NODE_24110_length_327_cov_0.679825_1_plen_56_part_01
MPSCTRGAVAKNPPTLLELLLWNRFALDRFSDPPIPEVEPQPTPLPELSGIWCEVW